MKNVCVKCRFYSNEYGFGGRFRPPHLCTYNAGTNYITGERVFAKCSDYNSTGSCPHFIHKDPPRKSWFKRLVNYLDHLQ